MPSEYPLNLRLAAGVSPTISSTSSARRSGSPAAAQMTRRWLRPVRPLCALLASRTAPTWRIGSGRSA